MRITHTIKFPIPGVSLKSVELDLSRFTFGQYLEHYFVFADINKNNASQPFKDAKHIERWYEAMEAFTVAASSWEGTHIALMKTPDRNSINKILADWMSFDDTALANSYIKHGYESFPLQCPIQSDDKQAIDQITLELPTVATSLAYDKAKNQLEKDWCLFHGLTPLSDEEVKRLAMRDYAQLKARCFDFLLETAAYFPSNA